WHEVLLEGRDAEGVGDLELPGLAVGALGAHEELAVAAEERRRASAVARAGLIEIAEDRLLGGRLHRAGVVGAPVGLRRLRVAARALRAADEGRRRGGRGLRGLGGLVGSLAPGRGEDGAERQRDARAAYPRRRGRAAPCAASDGRTGSG